MGPNLLFHLAGGLAEFSMRMVTWWKDLGSHTDWPPDSKQRIIDGVSQEGDRSVYELGQTRDEVLLKLRVRHTEASTSTLSKRKSERA